jgi:F-box-like
VLADLNARIMGILDGNIEQLHAASVSLHLRQVELQSELETNQSELLKANKLLPMAQQEYLELQIERDDLRTLMHPIRRCPDKILREIFELTVEDTVETKMRQSIYLSGVCQRWRSIALNTPRLWDQIFFILDKIPERQSLLRTFILPRVSQTQALVTARIISSHSTHQLMECGLQDIPVIENLTLVLQTPEDVQYLFRSCFRPPVGTLKALCVASCRPPETQFNCDVLSLVARFPPFHKLAIHHLPYLLFPVAVSNPNITELEIFNSAQLDILSIFRCFPRLRYMTIIRAALVDNDIHSTYHVPSIESIRLVNTTGEAWMERVFFPKLKTLSCAASSYVVHAFFSRHRSIIQLELGSVLSGDVIIGIVTVATQLETLHLAPPLESFCRLLELSSQITFPSLKYLTIRAYCPPNTFTEFTPPSNLTLEEFEAVACALCLPTRHPRSRTTQRSSVVSVFAIVAMDSATAMGNLGWSESDLYKESTKTVNREDPTKLYLSWPEWE